MNDYSPGKISRRFGSASSIDPRPWGPAAHTKMGWQIYPDGLRNLLTCVAGNHSGELMPVSAENGTA